MKRKIIIGLFVMILLQIYLISPVYAAIETSNYSWTLGKYNTSTKIFSPSNTSIINWSDMWVRTIGPWSIYNGADGTRQGTVISFVDKDKPNDNGYPMVCQDDWDEWITYFNGNPIFVKLALNKWSIKTGDNFTWKTFANFSQLVELCGGKGISYNISNSSSNYVRGYPPVASLTASSTAVKVGQPFKLFIKAQSYTYYYQFIDMELTGAGNTYINKRYMSTNVYEEKNLVFNSPGQYKFILRINDGVFRYAYKEILINVSENPSTPEQPPSNPPPPPPPSEPNQPPVARFSLPSETYEGDIEDVTENSYDSDGTIVDREWDVHPSTAVNRDLGPGGGDITFNHQGDYEVTLIVTDDDGATDSLTKSIKVLPPVPEAVITYSGYLKENRKVILSSSRSHSSEAYPIDHSKDSWTIDPIPVVSINDIKYGTKDGHTQEVLFKKPGTYKIGLQVSNSKYQSEWTYRTITIEPDIPPVAKFIAPTVAFRESLNNNFATVRLTDKSGTLDFDTISQRLWRYKFDSNNNGDFSDESWAILDNGNNTAPIFSTNHVGKYLFDLEVKEAFGQPTLPQFITDSDYKRGDTSQKANSEKIIEVQNIAPTTSFTAAIKPKVDIVFSQGFLEDYATRFPEMVSNLENIVGSKLQAKGIDYQFHNTSAMEDTGFDVVTIAPYNLYVIPKNYAYWYFDLGSLVDVNNPSFAGIEIYPQGGSGSNASIFISQDNSTYYTLEINRPETNNGTLYIGRQAGAPLTQFRYIQLRQLASQNWSSVTLKIYYKTTGGNVNYVSPGLFISNPHTSMTFDIGKQISREDLVTFHLGAYNLPPSGEIMHSILWYASSDGVNWVRLGYGSSWDQLLSLTPSELPFTFRYFKATFDQITVMYSRFYVTWNINLKSTPRATLSDIQAKANQSYRPDAIKYIVSLAEEPYIDANTTNYINAANTLNTNNAHFIAFTNSSGLSSVHQLTSKVTRQNVFTTTSDMSAPLSQLADYIVSSSLPSFSYGPFYILADQSLLFNPLYSDYENDPKHSDSWNYVHHPNFVDNNNGMSIYNGQTRTSPVSLFDKYGKYDVVYRAQDDPTEKDDRFSDYRLWSDPAPTSIIVHRKPIASFIVQKGTLYITDTSYDPDFQYKRPDKGIVEWYWQWKKTSDINWTSGKPSGITQPGDYVFYLKVRDCYGVWSNPYQMTVTVSQLNRPPIADFSWLPTQIYETDDVTLKNLSTDPDGDPISNQWTIYDPGGLTQTYSTKDVFVSDSSPGTFWVTLRVWDNHNATDAVTKSFIVNPLGVTGHVRHTDQWNNNRITHNRSISGTDNFPRPYTTFWAGEKFVLTAETTNTGASATKAQSVIVTMPATGASASLLPNADKTLWAGEIWQDSFINLSDGPYKFTFTAHYSNGAIKTCDVWIDINSSTYSYFRFHRAE